MLIFPIKCIKHRTADRSTIHDLDFYKEMTAVLVLPENDLI